MAVTLARLTTDEATARRVAALVAESFEDAACGAFESTAGWAAELLFPDDADRDAIGVLVAAAGGNATALTFTPLTDKDWVAESLAGLAPVHAGRFIVHGAHDRARVVANAIGIEIEAALAFGTGHHGTTKGCLLALDALAKRRRPKHVLDLGTGTGVLAIAAARLLHCRVLATDIDPVAAASARGNARRNRAAALVTAIRLSGCRGLVGRARYDLIFANILLGPLVRMATPLARLVAPGGQLVLSGLLAGQANGALAAYRAQGLVLEWRLERENWVTLMMRRHARRKKRPPRQG